MLDHQRAARILLLIYCAGQAVGTPAIDVNRTHATNPQWTPHARFHVVWQTVTQCCFAGLAGWLAWTSGAEGRWRFLVAEAILAVPPAGFLMAAAARRRYGGGLYDANGILPLRLSLAGRVLAVDLNLVVVAAGLVYLAAVFLLYRG